MAASSVSASQRGQQQAIAAVEHAVLQMSADTVDGQRSSLTTTNDDDISHVTSGDFALADDNR